MSYGTWLTTPQGVFVVIAVFAVAAATRYFYRTRRNAKK